MPAPPSVLTPVTTRPRKHVGFLDEIRGVAILGVFLYHALGVSFSRDQLSWVGWFRDFHAPKSFLLLLPLSFGNVGVPMFFVVSGFCIHLSFRRKPEWRDFWLRRFFRIYPPYFIALLLFALLIPWTRVPLTIEGFLDLATHCLLVHNLRDVSIFGINGTFWTIAVEVQLYLLYPVLVNLVARFGWKRFLSCALVLELFFRGILALNLMESGKLTPLWLLGLPVSFWFSWSIGAFLAEAYDSESALPFINQSALCWAGLAGFSYYFQPLFCFAFTIFSMLSAIIIAKLLRGDRFPVSFPPWFSSHLGTIGVWSFSIYLLHQPILMLAPRFTAYFSQALSKQPLIVFAVSMGLWLPTLLLSSLFYRFCEMPSMAFGKRWSVKTPLPVTIR